MPFETENGASNGNGLSSTLITLGIIARAPLQYGAERFDVNRFYYPKTLG